MTCSACSARVQKTVEKIEGTADVTVNLLTNSMQLQYDERETNPDAIIKAVAAAGYGASVKGRTAQQDAAGAGADPAKKTIADMKHRLIWSIAFLIPMMYISMHSMELAWIGIPVPEAVRAAFDGPENAVAFAFAQLLLLLPIMYLNRHYYIAGFRNLFHGAPNMDSLVGMGSMASALFGAFALFRIGWGLGHGDMSLVSAYSTNLYFESAGMIVTLITVGKYLEARAKGETGRALEALTKLAPRDARVVQGEAERVIPIEQLTVGDLVRVRPGERIPADGTVVSGMASVDEAAITGESIPAAKEKGASVTSATMVRNGTLIFRAERVGEDTTIRQIIRLASDASATKAPIARLADRVAGVFVPAVISVALIAGGVWLALGASVEFAFSIAISILVVSCPCALGLATPVAIMVGTGKGAENGILIKSGEAIETAHAIDTVIMDKTGTITEGKPRVTQVVTFGKTNERDLVALAAGLEAGSEHPLAEAVLRYAEEKDITPVSARDFRAVFGRGVTAEVEGHRCYAGNAKLLEENAISVEPVRDALAAMADNGETPLLFARDHAVIGVIGAADMEKATSAEAIRRFEAMGISVVMLTGDNARTAEAIRRRLGLERAIAGVLPEDKEKHIAALQAEGHKVAMIGDGINDAPALARADLGIAIGAGTDVAIESADAVLMRSDLLDAVSAIRLSKAVIKNIKENLFWAFFYNAVCIPLAAGVFYSSFGVKMSPAIGAAAMSMSSFCVVMNALRLRFFRTDHLEESAAHGAAREESSPEEQKEENTMEKTIQIKGMMCAHCQKHVHDALAKMDGVTAVRVDLDGGTATVMAERDIQKSEFKQVIEEAGYELVG